jgi:hypothetical protein
MKIKPINENEIIVETKRGRTLSIFDTDHYTAITTTTNGTKRKIEIDVNGDLRVDDKVIGA